MNWVLWKDETNIKEVIVGTKLLHQLLTDGISRQWYKTKPKLGLNKNNTKNKKWVL